MSDTTMSYSNNTEGTTPVMTLLMSSDYLGHNQDDVLNLKVNTSYAGQSMEVSANEEAALYMFIFWGIFLPVVAAVGLVGNILTMIVLWRKEMHSTTILYLRALVITDTGILIGAVFTLTIIACATYLQGELTYFRTQVYPIIHTPGYYLVMALQQCNVWITVSVSMERYIAICHPFRAARLVTRRKTFMVLISIAIISLLYNIPHLFATHAVPCPTGDDTTAITASHNISSGSSTAPRPSTASSTSQPWLYSINRTDNNNGSFSVDISPASSSSCLIVEDTAFGQTWTYTMYRKVLYTVIIYVIPFLALVVLNSFLIRELMIMQRRRSGTNIHDENEANLSMVLVLIVIVFMFCQTPGLVSQFDIIPFQHFFKWLAFSNFMFATNSAVNFLIYTAFGRKFRRVLLRVFRRIYHGRRSMFSHGSCRATEITDYELSQVNTLSHFPPLRSEKVFTKESKNNGIRVQEQKLLSTVAEVSSTGTNDAISNGGPSAAHEDRHEDSPPPSSPLANESYDNTTFRRETDPLTSNFEECVPTSLETTKNTESFASTNGQVNFYETSRDADHSTTPTDDNQMHRHEFPT